MHCVLHSVYCNVVAIGYLKIIQSVGVMWLDCAAISTQNAKPWKSQIISDLSVSTFYL